MSLKTFRSGIHPLHKIHHGKSLSENSPIKRIPDPRHVVIPMSQHIGAPCTPCVNVGDHVFMGQKIGEVRGYVSAPVHASVSGTVTKIEPHVIVGGATPECVTIENDLKYEWDPSIKGADPTSLSKQELIARVLEGGIVGMGGATFPAHVKLSPPEDTKIEYLLLNGAECEPYLTADHRMMLEKAEGIIRGAAIIAKILDVKETIIGIENNKKDAIAIMQKAAAPAGIKVQAMQVKYPQGSEKQLIQALTGRQVPSGKLPMNAGCVVCNVSSAFAVYEAVELGRPLIRRVVTVTGSGIQNPKNLDVPIGTMALELIEYCGGLKDNVSRLVSGGPMMGIAMFTSDVPITKGSSGVLALTPKEVPKADEGPCIHCGRCVRGCPIHLMPFELYDDKNKNDWEAAEKHNAMDCIECGSCSYICPAKREITSAIRIAKRQILEARKK